MKTIVHIPNVNSRESLKAKYREVEEIMDRLGAWKGVDPATGFDLIELPAEQGGRTLKVADLVDDSDLAQRSKVLAALKDPTQRDNRDHVDIIRDVRRCWPWATAFGDRFRERRARASQDPLRTERARGPRRVHGRSKDERDARPNIT